MPLSTKMLKELGFSKAETALYVVGLRLGESPASVLAQEMGIPRTRAYHTLKKLQEKGLVSRTGSIRGGRFRMEAPKRLKEIVERKRAEWKSMEQEMNTMSLALESLRPKTTHPARVRFYDGTEGLKNVAMEALETKEKFVRSLSAIPQVMKSVDRPFLRHWFAELRDRKIHSQSIWTHRTKDADFHSPFRDQRLVPNGMRFPSTLLIYDETVAVFTLGKKTFTFVIESRDFAETMKAAFDQIWKVSRSL